MVVVSQVSASTQLLTPPDSKAAKRRKWTIIALLMLLHFSAFACYSLMAPFFPTVMVAKGGNAAFAAWIIAVYQLALLVLTPFLGGMVTEVGSKIMLNTGVLVLGSSTVLFGFMWWAPHGAQFIGLTFAIRIIEGVGMAFYLTASFSIVANTFPDNVGFVMGLLQTSLGVGLTIGPGVENVIGSFLYELGGFPLPFFLFGGVLLLSDAIVLFLLPEQPDIVQIKKAGFFRLLAIPHIALDALVLVTSAWSLGFFESLVALHIAPLVGGNAMLISLAILCTGLFQGLSAPLWGKAADKHLLPPKVLCVIGCVLTSISWLFIGPVPFLPIPTLYWIIIVAVAVLGLGNGCLLAIPFGDALAGAIANGYPNNFDTFGYVSALFPCMYALGAVVGPLIGGPLVDRFGFRVASLPVLGIQVVCGILLAVYEMQRLSVKKLTINRVTPVV